MKRFIGMSILILAVLIGWIVLPAEKSCPDKTLPVHSMESIAPERSDLLQFTAAGHVLMFKPAEVILAAGDHALKVGFIGASNVQPSQEGEPAKAGKGAAPLQRIVYRDLYPGVDLIYEKSAAGMVKSTWHIAAGKAESALKVIAIQYNVQARIEKSGELVLTFKTGEMRESRPVAWQEIEGNRVPVEATYRLINEQEVGFKAGSYDPRYPLLIDPVLSWNTFLGGSGNDYGNGIAVDASGNVYVAGYSPATWGSPVRPYAGGSSDAFVAKLDGSGALQWNTFLGGSSVDWGYAIAVDTSGNVYVTGTSDGAWGSPVRPCSGYWDAFVAKLDGSGALQWNTFLGGSVYDDGFGIAVDTSGNVYVTGDSWTTWGSPVCPCAGYDAFAAKLNNSGALQWNTFLGSSSGDYGSGTDSGYGIAVDTSGNVYVTGTSNATWGSPVRPFGGELGDAFVAKLDGSGALQWNTFLGGSSVDDCDGIAVDTSGNVYVTGMSGATWGLPVRPFAGNTEAFVAKLNGSGALQWNTFLGSSGGDSGNGIAVDTSGNVYVAGSSEGAWGSPVPPYPGGWDAFAAKLNGSGDLRWNGFLGAGGPVDMGNAIAIDTSGNVYVAGDSQSTWGSPVRPFSGSSDAFVAKLRLTQISGNTGTEGVTLSYDDGGAKTVTSDGSGNYVITVPVNWSGTVTPTLAGYTFSPVNRTYTNVTADQTAQDYTASVIPDAITLLSPNGGESWAVGSIHNITWTSTGTVGVINIVYTTDGGSSWNPVVNGTENDGSYTWTIPATPSANCKVQVSEAVDDNPADQSDAVFTIVNTHTISGSVTWNGSLLGNVTMNGLPGDPTPVTDASGFYTATVNNGWSGTVTPTQQYFTFTPASTTYTSIASSQTTNYTATLTQNLVVTAPYSTSLWERGKTYAITWLKQGPQNANVKILLYKGTATLVKTIVATTPNDGSYDWLVPTALATGSTYFIKVKTVDNLIYDDSEKFSIIVPTITVTAPASGAIWVKNATKTITWSRQGTQDANVRIQLYRGIYKKLDITLSAPNSGTNDWLIPSTLVNAANYFVRVTTLDNKVIGKSAKFSIAAGMIQVTQPVAGNKLIRGTPKVITWFSEGAVNANVKIQLYRGTTKVQDISLSTPTADGTISWDIPANLALLTTYSIKVTAVDNLVAGKSGTFAIVAGIITVTQPTAGTIWQRGVGHTITWSGEGPLNANVKVLLVKGTTVVSTLATTTANDGSFDWTIAAGQALAANYKIRIITVDNLVKADSSVFTISNTAGLTLLAPNGAMILKAVETQAIRWSDDPDVLEVKLEFSRDNGGTFTTIADHVADTGSYDWKVPVNFTRNAIVRVSDSNGKLWREDGLLEFSFKFNYGGVGEEPGAVFWFGSRDPKSPSYGFARIEIGSVNVQFGGFNRVIEPLAGDWHELRVRFNFRRDTAEIRLDDRMLFENAALYTTPEHFFQPCLVLQTGGEAPLAFTMDDLAINIVQLDSAGEDRQMFNALTDNFDRYDEKANALQNCWQWPKINDRENKVELNAENPLNKSLRLQSEADKQLMIYLPFALPDRIPFDISDQCLVIENR